MCVCACQDVGAVSAALQGLKDLLYGPRRRRTFFCNEILSDILLDPTLYDRFREIDVVDAGPTIYDALLTKEKDIYLRRLFDWSHLDTYYDLQLHRSREPDFTSEIAGESEEEEAEGGRAAFASGLA